MNEEGVKKHEQLSFEEINIGSRVSVVSGIGDAAIRFNLVVTDIVDGRPMGQFTIKEPGCNDVIGNLPMLLLGCVTVADEKIDGIHVGAYLHIQPGGRGGSMIMSEPGREISEIIVR